MLQSTSKQKCGHFIVAPFVLPARAFREVRKKAPEGAFESGGYVPLGLCAPACFFGGMAGRLKLPRATAILAWFVFALAHASRLPPVATAVSCRTHIRFFRQAPLAWLSVRVCSRLSKPYMASNLKAPQIFVGQLVNTGYMPACPF